MRRGQKRKAEEPLPPSSWVLSHGNKIEIESTIDQSKPETRHQQSNPKPTLKAVRRRRGRAENLDSINEIGNEAPPETPAGNLNILDCQQQQNPLLIHVIVKNLLEVWAPDFNTLKTARLVCKTWFQETLPLWRSTAVLTLAPDVIQKIVNLSTEAQTEKLGGMKIAEFEKHFLLHSEIDILQLARIPFSRFCLKSWEIKNNECGAIPSFWNILRPLVKYMRLQTCEFRVPSSIVESRSTISNHMSLLTLIFQNLTEMETLIVDRCQFLGEQFNTDPEEFGFRAGYLQSYQRGGLRCPKSATMNLANGAPPDNHRNLRTLEVIGELPFFWRPFLRLFPNLERIRSRTDDSGDYNCLTSAIQILRQENRESLNIQHLDLMSTLAFRLDAPGLELLNKCNLNLQSLCIELGNSELPIFDRIHRQFICDNLAKRLVKEMLAPQQDTLRVLKFFRIASCDNGPIRKFSFGDNLTLANLSEVHLYGPITDSFEFLGNVPNLRKLVINQKCEENWRSLPEFRISSTNRFKGNMIKITPAELFKNFANSAPLEKLTFLHVDLRFPAQSLETLAMATPNLRILQTILNNASLITAGKKWRSLEELKLIPGSMVTDSGIIKFANFATLKKFVLQTYRGDESLGDGCVNGGFLKMEGLHTLEICVSRKMTKNGETQLSKNIQEVVVHRNYGKLGNCRHGNYCRDAMIKKPRCLCFSIVNHAEGSQCPILINLIPSINHY